MSTGSMIFIKVLHVLISESVGFAENVLYGAEISSNDFFGGDLSAGDIYTLRTIHISKEQKLSIRKLLLALSRISVVGVLSVIDGMIVSEKLDLPDLSLVDRNSQKDIADDLPLNEAFYIYADEE